MKSSYFAQTSRSFQWNGYAHPLVNPTSSSYEVQTVERRFGVTNGLLAGNRKDPTPYSFQKDQYFPHRGSESEYRYATGSYWLGGYLKSYSGFDTVLKSSNFTDAAAGSINDSSGPIFSQQWLNPLSETGITTDRALSKIYDQIRSGPNLLVDLLEGGTTIRMIRETINLKKFTKNFFDNLVIPRRLRDNSKGQKRLDYMTSKWMEARYGWSPIVYSIYDSFDQLNKQVFNQIYELKGRSGLKYSGTWVDKALQSSFVPGSFYSGATSGQATSVWNYSRSTRTHLVMQYEMTPGQFLHDWTSMNPYVIAWELFPLSFVADWALGMGYYLELMENHGLFADDFRGGYITLSFKGKATQQYVRRASHSLGAKVSSRVDGGMMRTFKRRELLTSQPHPSGIHIQLKMNAKRMLDAASLLHLLVAKRFR